MFVRVHVVPDAKKEKVTKESDTVFQIMVKEPAERNLANGRVRQLLAEAFGVAVGKVQIVTGHRSPTKMFDVEV